MWHGTYEHRCPYAGNLRRACGGRTDGVRTSKTAILSLCGIQWWKARLFIGFKHAYRFRYSEYFQSIIDHIDAYRYFKFIYNIAYTIYNTVNTKPNWYRYIIISIINYYAQNWYRSIPISRYFPIYRVSKCDDRKNQSALLGTSRGPKRWGRSFLSAVRLVNTSCPCAWT